jgi:hypothetical protein
MHQEAFMADKRNSIDFWSKIDTLDLAIAESKSGFAVSMIIAMPLPAWRSRVILASP